MASLGSTTVPRRLIRRLVRRAVSKAREPTFRSSRSASASAMVTNMPRLSMMQALTSSSSRLSAASSRISSWGRPFFFSSMLGTILTVPLKPAL